MSHNDTGLSSPSAAQLLSANVTSKQAKTEYIKSVVSLARLELDVANPMQKALHVTGIFLK